MATPTEELKSLFAAERQASGMLLEVREVMEADSVIVEDAAADAFLAKALTAEARTTDPHHYARRLEAAESGLWKRRYALVQKILDAEAQELRAKAVAAQDRLDEHRKKVSDALAKASALETPSDADEPVIFRPEFDTCDLRALRLTGEPLPTPTKSYLLACEADAAIALASQAESRKPVTAGAITGELIDAGSIEAAGLAWQTERLTVALGPRWSTVEPAAERLIAEAETAWQRDPSTAFQFVIGFADGEVTTAKLERLPEPRPVAAMAA